MAKLKRHRGGHVDVGIGAAQQWQEAMMTVAVGGVPTHGSHSGNQAEVVAHQDEEEHGAEKPEGPLGQMRAHQAGEEIIERLDHPFGEVLETRGNQRHLARRRPAERTINPTASQTMIIELVIGRVSLKTLRVERQRMMRHLPPRQARRAGSRIQKMAVDRKKRMQRNPLTVGAGSLKDRRQPSQVLFVKNFTSSENPLPVMDSMPPNAWKPPGCVLPVDPTGSLRRTSFRHHPCSRRVDVENAAR